MIKVFLIQNFNHAVRFYNSLTGTHFFPSHFKFISSFFCNFNKHGYGSYGELVKAYSNAKKKCGGHIPVVFCFTGLFCGDSYSSFFFYEIKKRKKVNEIIDKFECI